MIKEKSVGGIIYREEDKKRFYLILEYERINDKEGKHKYWDFPKGHIEPNEKESDTLFREIKEETGLTNINLILGFKENLAYFFKKDNLMINKEVVYYLLKTDENEIKISFEHSNFKWSEYKEAIKLVSYKSSKDILRKAENFLNNSLLNYT